MAVAAYDTQQGATITLATDSLSMRIVSIGALTESYEIIPLTHLANTTKKTWTVGELADYEQIAVIVQNSPGIANPSIPAQTVTITGPTASGASTPESATGTAFCLKRDLLPGFNSASEGLQTKTFIVKFDGLTGPTRTVSS